MNSRLYLMWSAAHNFTPIFCNTLFLSFLSFTLSEFQLSAALKSAQISDVNQRSEKISSDERLGTVFENKLSGAQISAKLSA